MTPYSEAAVPEAAANAVRRTMLTLMFTSPSDKRWQRCKLAVFGCSFWFFLSVVCCMLPLAACLVLLAACCLVHVRPPIIRPAVCVSLGLAVDGGPNSRKLPGPLAAVLTRRHLSTTVRSNYLVCEKSDGDRRMMLIHNGRVYLADRKFDIFEPCSSKEIGAAVTGQGHPLLLDGELVDGIGGTCPCVVAVRCSRHTACHVRCPAGKLYLAFDVIACGKLGNAAGSMPLDKRVKMITENVVKPFHAVYGAGSPALRLLCKEYMPTSKIATLMSCIKPSGRHRVYRRCVPACLCLCGYVMAHLTFLCSLDQSRPLNLNDGVVFTPLSIPYLDLFNSKTPVPLLKWKFLDEVRHCWCLCVSCRCVRV